MDRNPNDLYGTPGASGSGANPQNTGADFGVGGTGASRSSEYGGTGASRGSDFETTPEFGRAETATGRELADTTTEESQRLRERAREKLGHARETASEKLGEAHRKAHDFKLRFADKLDAQAERLRARGTSTTSGFSSADEGMSALSTNDSQRSRVGDKLAGGMHSTADWLRHNDLDSMKRNVEEQVRTNPGRSLLVAAVAGYLIGKVMRRRG
jgi:ElaB/YqjD/DUF883 family membrane-anchored ribosome-binding protein